MIQSLLLPCKPKVGFITNMIWLRRDSDWRVGTKGLGNNKLKLFVSLPDQEHFDSQPVKDDIIIPGGAKVYVEVLQYEGPDLISIHAEGVANGT